jgi:hypothetical protein
MELAAQLIQGVNQEVLRLLSASALMSSDVLACVIDYSDQRTDYQVSRRFGERDTLEFIAQTLGM